MASKGFLVFLFVLSLDFLGLSRATQLSVGGKDGWALNPSDNYFSYWAQRYRFQVNDTLFFKYNGGSDSVLEVKKDDYYSCNTTNPIVSLTKGDSVFALDRSGPFFFISGNAEHCQKGQKLLVVVMAERNNQNKPKRTPAASISPAESTNPRYSITSDLDSPAPAPVAANAGIRVFTGGSLFGLAVVLVLGSFCLVPFA
ncbi:hypothetical protein UlMin_020746 [Ulmus minor]